MEMDDNKLKSLLQEAMEYEADCIMEEVDSDPNVKDVVAPEDLHVNLMKQIREYEDAKEKERENQAKEEQELIRLGRIYKKKRCRRKYIVLIAAVLCTLGVGMVSFGDAEKVFTEMKRTLGDREQTVVNTDDGDGTVVDEIASEAEAYEQIEDKFGFVPVKMFYIPDGMDFVEASIDENLMSARLCYSDTNGRLISYYVATNYRSGSVSTDVEDQLINEYEKEIGGVLAKVQQYLIEENEAIRFRVIFEYNNAQYIITMTGIEETEVEKIVDNLYFS